MPLPQGTVTFLFTDIEGSTRLLQHLGDRYADVLADQRRLLRAAFEQWHGHELGTEGDSFFVAFSRASDALAAVVAGQRALASHSWPDGLSVRVRMGLHTGEPTLTPEGYIGIDVHRAARVNGCGHGGQVLLSQHTRDLAADALPDSVSFKDLGAHRLKDLLHPERLFQVVIEGLPADFPPLKSLSAHPNNLPLQLSSFVGREREMAQVRELLGKTRLLTLTGTGGAGKTRLALQIAADMVEEYADGVWLVELAALTDGDLVAQTVASAFHLREEPGRPLTETLLDYLRAKATLLLLDNCEHLIDACARLVEKLLRSCPKLRVLATSREALGITGEVASRVPSLPVPDPRQLGSTPDDEVARVSQYEGVRLFVERGAAVSSGFTVTRQNAISIAEVCHRLDGIPLAIELAAARVKALPVEKIVERLDDRFRLLTGGSRTALPRQQTLRALIDWSYELLTEPERVLLRRLSVFAGGWTLEAAEAVCVGEEIEEWEVLDLLVQLVDRSLVQYEECSEEARYQLLETIRQYGTEKLAETGEAVELARRHRDWYLALAVKAEPEVGGPRERVWLDRLEREHDNLRGALAVTVQRNEAEVGMTLGAALRYFWNVRGYLSEGRQHLERLLGLAGTEDTKAVAAVRAKVLNGAAALAYRQGEYEAARAWVEESLAIHRSLSDQQGIAVALANLGEVVREQGGYEAAETLFTESLAIQRELGDRRGIARLLQNLGGLALNQGNYRIARELLQEGIEIQQQIGERRAAAHSYYCLGFLELRQGGYLEARRRFDESLLVFQELGDEWGIAASILQLGHVAQFQGDTEAAHSLFTNSERIQRKLGEKRGIAWSLASRGNLAREEGEYEAAWALYEESLAIRRQLQDKWGIANSLASMAVLRHRQGDAEAAFFLCRDSLRLRQQVGDRLGIVECIECLAGVTGKETQPERAARLFGAASRLREGMGAPLPPSERVKNERAVVAAREALGEEAFAAAWAEGRGMSVEQAVARALDEEP